MRLAARLAGLAGGYLGARMVGRVLEEARQRAAAGEQLVASYEAWIAGLAPAGHRDCLAAEQSPPRNRSGR